MLGGRGERDVAELLTPQCSGGLGTSPHLPEVCWHGEGRVLGTSRDGDPSTVLTFAPCTPLPVPAERDVSRTDRTNKFYEGPENPGLSLLNDILLTYCMYHFDRGAAPAGRASPWGCQGPGPGPDLLSPQATSRA